MFVVSAFSANCPTGARSPPSPRPLTSTPSAVSQQLGAAEREAGVALLSGAAAVYLTPAGWSLVGHAHAVRNGWSRRAPSWQATRDGIGGPQRSGPSHRRAAPSCPPPWPTRPDPSRAQTDVDEIDPARVVPPPPNRRTRLALVHEYDFVPASDAGTKS